MGVKRVWLDCDPGHDDAIAILLALHIPEIELIGVSTVHGNTDAENTLRNAIRCLYAFGAPNGIQVSPGASEPLIKKAKHDPEIHGIDGLGGVEGLPSAEKIPTSASLQLESGKFAVEAMGDAVLEAVRDDRSITIVSTGPMTNIALFVSVRRNLLRFVEEFVFMGGGVGQGNRSSVAEYNILCDPEAAQIVLNCDVRKTMIPINVTHTAILTQSVHAALLDRASCPFPPTSASPFVENGLKLPTAKTPLRHTLSTLVSFFAASYASTFGFTSGPPLHDALTLAYVAHPELFTVSRKRVDIELKGEYSSGETVVDLFGYREKGLAAPKSWGRDGVNCLIAEKLDVEGFWSLFLDCVDRCDRVSPLNG